MSVSVVAATANLSGTLDVPAGIAAGDLIVAIIRSFSTYTEDSSPISGPAGWTEVDNYLWGAPAGAGYLGATWCVGTYVRVVDGTEAATYTWTCDGAEALIGAMVAVTSTIDYGLGYVRSGTNSGPFGAAFQSWYDAEPASGSLAVHAMSGLGTEVLSYTGFTGTRTHHSLQTLHSDTPFSTSPPSGSVYEHYRDFMLSIETETGTLTYGTRYLNVTFPSPSGTGTYWANTWVTVTETAPAAVPVSWTGWIID